MASNRSRANRTIIGKVGDIAQRVSHAEKSGTPASVNYETNSITGDALAPDSVGTEQIARAAIGTEQLGIINEIVSDSTITLRAPDLFASDTNARTLLVGSEGKLLPGPLASERDSGVYDLAGTSSLNPFWGVGVERGQTWCKVSRIGEPSSGVAELTLYITAGSWGAGTEIGWLPVGFRPRNIEWINAHFGSGLKEVKILPTGLIVAGGGTTSGGIVISHVYHTGTGYKGNGRDLPKVYSLSMENGWTRNTSGQNRWAQPTYSKTSSGIVHLTGLVSPGTATVGTTIATLPEGFRPRDEKEYAVATSSGVVGLNVSASGAVRTWLNSPAAGSWISLDSISFPTVDSYVNNLASDPIVLQNGWTSITGYNPPRVDVDANGVVWTTLNAQSGTPTDQTVIGTIPASYGIPTVFTATSGTSSTLVKGRFGTPGTSATGSSYMVEATGTPTTGLRYGFNHLKWLHPTLSSGLTSWQAVSLLSGWVNYGSGYQSAKYAKTPDGQVLLSGLVANGSVGASNGDASMFWLPPGSRPDQSLVFIVASSNGTGRLDIFSDGGVQYTSGSTGWVSLDGISFIAHQ